MKRRSPAYYIRKRLLSNTASMISVGIIVLYVLVALSGTLLMPDKTIYANDGAIEIQKRPPGFSTYILKLPKQEIKAPSNILLDLWKGKPANHVIIPVKTYTIRGAYVEYTTYQRSEKKLRIPLASFLDSEFSPTDTQTYVKDIWVCYEKGEKLNKVHIQTAYKIIEEKYIEKRFYILGTDKAGRDLLSRLIYGARISLSIGFMSVIVSVLIGFTVGAIGGYFGGIIDKGIQWLMTVVWSIPAIMLVIAISLAIQSKGIWVAFIAVGLTTWVEVARVIRGQVLSIKEKTYIEAAKALGYNHLIIIKNHIFPNLVGPLIVIATGNFATALLIESGLSFLGLGLQPPIPSWGVMIHEGYQTIGTNNSWHLILFPSITISILVLSFNIFGNGLRDAYDPTPLTKL